MKKPLLNWIGIFTLGILSCGWAQDYVIDWSTIDGGGGASTGSVYSLSGTIGQPDGGQMTGGYYVLDGGFWGVVAAVQMAGAPQLSITLTTPNTVIISWSYPSTGFALQQNTMLGTTNWINVIDSPVQVGQEWQMTVRPSVGNNFYRLAK